MFLQDGEMKVKYVQEDGQEYQMEAKDIFDHGIWKEIRLSKKDNALSLTIDSRISVTIEVPKRLHLAKTVVLGGLSNQEGLVVSACISFSKISSLFVGFVSIPKSICLFRRIFLTLMDA